MGIFHLAFDVGDLDGTCTFYGDRLGCREGRGTERRVDCDLFGHQISLHLGPPFMHRPTGRVGEQWVPMPHCDVLLKMGDWRDLVDQLEAEGQDFVIAPTLRIEGRPGEQATMFLLDPFEGPLESKRTRDPARQVFAT